MSNFWYKILGWFVKWSSKALSDLEKSRADSLLGVARGPGWSKARKEHLVIESTCRGCGTNEELEVHHIEMFSKAPHLECVQSNLITLCRRCHKLIGHLDSWFSYNSEVRKDASNWKLKIINRPK